MLSVIEQRLNEYDIDTEIQQENALKEITQEIKWKELKKDVKHFVQMKELDKIESWSVEFFMKRLEKLTNTLIK